VHNFPQEIAMTFKPLILAATMLAGSVALAQSGRDPSSGSDMMAKASSTDATFMKKLAEGDLAEIDAGRLASQKSASEGVKSFGQEMVNDHSKNNTDLQTLAASHGVNVPTTIDSAHASEKTRLEGANGTGFDSLYIKDQVRDHEKTVALIEQEIRNGQDTSVKDFAKKTLPVVRHHLAMAKQLQAKLPNTVADRSTP
jgi:putative membrane protein